MQPKHEPLSRYGNPASYVVRGKRYHVLSSRNGYRERGLASWYGPNFHGKLTSNREVYDMYGMTAAHKTLPLPTYARVTRRDTGQSVVVRINDRGPFHEGRIIDLSYSAARRLGIDRLGTAEVLVEAIEPAASPAGDEPATDTPPPRGTALAETYIQAGVFRESDNALQLRDRLEQELQNLPILVQADQIDRRPVYRVMVGPLSGNDEVRQVGAMLEFIGYRAPQVLSLPKADAPRQGH